MFILALFTITKIWKRPKIWMKREKEREGGILFSHKNEEIPPFVTTCIEPEDIMLSEISHTEKDKYCIISLICEILKQNKQTKKSEREIRLMVTRGRVQGGEIGGKWSKDTNVRLQDE